MGNKSHKHNGHFANGQASTAPAYYENAGMTPEPQELTEDLWIAEFWSDDVEGLMISPPGRQISIANQLISQFDLDFEDTLIILLKLGFSLKRKLCQLFHAINEVGMLEISELVNTTIG